MLGRTASSLFWMSRYMERAENMARLLEAGYRISLTPGAGGHRNEWRSTLVSAASLDNYVQHHGDVDELDGERVAHFLLFDQSNPSSVRSCIEAARNNGRGVRMALTRDMWEALNATWVEFSALRPADIRGAHLPEVLETIRQRGIGLKQKLARLADEFPDIIEEVRGVGLMMGIKCKVPNGDVVQALFGEKMLTVPAGENVVRIIPPLIVADEDLDEAVNKMEAAFNKLRQHNNQSAQESE